MQLLLLLLVELVVIGDGDGDVLVVIVVALLWCFFRGALLCIAIICELCVLRVCHGINVFYGCKMSIFFDVITFCNFFGATMHMKHSVVYAMFCANFGCDRLRVLLHCVIVCVIVCACNITSSTAHRIARIECLQANSLQ